MKKSKTQQQKWKEHMTTGAANKALGHTKEQIRDLSAKTTKENTNRKKNTSITSPTNWGNCWKTLWEKRREDGSIISQWGIRKQTETHTQKTVKEPSEQESTYTSADLGNHIPDKLESLLGAFTDAEEEKQSRKNIIHRTH